MYFNMGDDRSPDITTCAGFINTRTLVIMRSCIESWRRPWAGVERIMNCLLINGSARLEGNTALALDYIQGCLVGHEVERLDLGRRSICMCRGCRLCFDKGEEACPLKDDLLEIHRRMLGADLIVMGGPIYVEDLSGLTKNWIDRLAFNCHRPALYRQKAFLLLSSGSGATAHAMGSLERAVQTWGIEVLGKRRLILGARITKADLEGRFGTLLGKDIRKALSKAARRKRPSFLRLLTFSIQQWYYRNDEEKDSFDYRYWKEQGWLDRGRGYYFDVKIGLAQRALIKVLGGIIIRVFLR